MRDPMQPNVGVSPPEVLEIVRCGCSTDTPCSTAICGCYTSRLPFMNVLWMLQRITLPELADPTEGSCSGV